VEHLKEKEFRELIENKRAAERLFNYATEAPIIDLAIAEIRAIDYQIDKFIIEEANKKKSGKNNKKVE